MNFEQLKIFLSVVDYKSFTRAAESLYISHSTTSRNVSALEEELGVMLLVRNNKSVKLTAAGEILYREGQKLLKKIEAVESAVRNAGMGMSGELAVASAGQYMPDLWLGFRDFCKKYPDISVGLYQRTADDVFQLVEGGEADVGLTFSYALPEDCAELVVERISEERFCLAVAADDPLAQRGQVEAEEIRQLPYIALSVSDGEHNWTIPDRIAALLPSTVTYVPTVESLFLQIRSGNGVSILPRPMVGDFGAGCAMLDIEGIDPGFDVVMLWRKDNYNPCLPLMVDVILAEGQVRGEGETE